MCTFKPNESQKCNQNSTFISPILTFTLSHFVAHVRKFPLKSLSSSTSLDFRYSGEFKEKEDNKNNVFI